MRDPYASGSKTVNATCDSYLDAHKASIQKWDAAENPGRSPHIMERHVIIISHRRGDPSISQNAGVCGWGFLCHPSDAHDMFHALTENGKACTIGLVEEVHVRMESEIRCPFFRAIIPTRLPDNPIGMVMRAIGACFVSVWNKGGACSCRSAWSAGY